MTPRELILVGGGGHCRACIDVIEQEGKWRIAGIVDRPESLGANVLGYPVLGSDADLPVLAETFRHFFITLGQIKSPAKRRELFALLKGLGAELPAIISPQAYVSRHAAIGEGTIVMHRALVNAGAAVGRNCILNTRALVEHDSAVGDHCHISTGAILNGGVQVAEGTFVGSRAVTRQEIRIGAGCIVGAGAVVLKDLAAGTVFTGRDRDGQER